MYVLPGIDEQAWDLLGLKADSFLREAVDKHSEQIDTIMSAFF